MPGSGTTTTRRVEVFRPGTFTAMSGVELSFSADDVAAIAAAYDPDIAPAPVVVGHPQHDDPAFGWARRFEVTADGVLVAEIGDLAPAFVDAVQAGRYRKISMMFFPPSAQNNPKPGAYYPRHIGFLGGAAPAVSGLRPVAFAQASDAELVEIAFVDPALRDVASLFRKFRDWLIETAGLEAADKVAPDWTITWIDDAGRKGEDAPPAPIPAFTAPPSPAEPLPKETHMDADAMAARERAIAAREAAAAHSENIAFVDGLIAQTRLLPALRDRTVALLDRVATGDEAAEAIAFADGSETRNASPASLMRDILSAAPPVVMLGRTDMGGAPDSVSLVRFDFEWVSAFNNGHYAFDHKGVSSCVKAAIRAGLQPLVIWKGAGSWDRAKWAAFQPHIQHFSTTFANHFASIGCLLHELGNEPNLDSFMDNAVPVATMMDWHRATYDAIKAAQPRATVISAGLSPVPTPSSNPSSARPALGFVEQMFAAGLKGKMDGLGFHPYAWENMPLSGNSWNGFRIMHRDIRNLMVAKGAGEVRIWSTEFGFPTGGTAPNRSGTEAQQLQTLTDAYDFLAATDWAGPVFWYNLDDYQVKGKTQNSEDYYGAFRVDGSRKPVANLLTNIKRGG